MEMHDLGQQENEPLLDCDGSQQTSPLRSTAYCQPGIKGLFSSRYVVYCALFAALGGLLFGYDQGVISVILVEPQFLQRFWEVADNAPGAGFYKGLLTAMIEFGALFGAFNQGWIADWISRKYSIMLAAGIFIAGSILQTSAISYSTLVFARFVGGIGIGMLSMVTPLYISEISPPEIRGSLLVLEELSIVTGIVIAFWITYGTRHIDSEWAWRLPFALQILPGLMLAIGISYLPFSPRWLMAQDRDQDASRSLCQLRQLPETDARIIRELEAIKTEIVLYRSINAEQSPEMKHKGVLQRELTSWADLFRQGCWHRTRIGIGIMFFQQFVGINALIYYAPSMLKILGLSYDTRLIMSGIINMAQLLGVVTSIWTMDHIGRRPLLLSGSLVMFVCHLVIATLVGRFSHDWNGIAGWTCVALLLFYMFAFGATWGPVPWCLSSELFTQHLRARGVAISACSNWLNNGIIATITPGLVENTGYGAYVFFACFCLLSLVWTYYLVPETAGKSLEEINQVFHTQTHPSGRRHNADRQSP
ncbi:hypothetical protein AMS68_005982 [Peltaster fructicola]|uniref:Major facilitator superfamily (MFS) profile domain-containing protein n=1 Tax=Peltaster fructicola TaxID=286661 RepID=A0A6H0Y0N0_9PEZI|nr:hypothetical protein AMS68_005982 [Peltaster fructicola]